MARQAVPVRPARGRAGRLLRGDRADQAGRQARIRHRLARRAPLPYRAIAHAGQRARSWPRCRRSPTRSVSASASRSRRTSSATRSTPRRPSPSVDLLSRGRVEWGTGRSIPHEQKAFGVDPATSRDSWREAIESVVAMWEQEKFSWDSAFMKFPEFPSYDGDTRSITPKPYQDPHPPAWMAAVSPDSVELAGSLGLGMLSLTIMQSVDELEKRIKIYREASANCTEPITRVKNNKVGAVHPRPLRRGHGQGRVVRLWELGRLVVRPPRPVHHRLGASAEHATGGDREDLPAPARRAGGQGRPEVLQRPGHGHHRRTRGVPREAARATRRSAATR